MSIRILYTDVTGRQPQFATIELGRLADSTAWRVVDMNDEPRA